MSDLRSICDFEHALTIGQRVEVRWTCGSFGHYTAIGKVAKINKASVRIALENAVQAREYGSWPAGHEIVVPLFLGTMYSSNSKWAQFNRVAPLPA